MISGSWCQQSQGAQERCIADNNPRREIVCVSTKIPHYSHTIESKMDAEKPQPTIIPQNMLKRDLYALFKIFFYIHQMALEWFKLHSLAS